MVAYVQHQTLMDLILLGELTMPLGTAASTDSPNVIEGTTVIRFYRSGSTIILEAYDTVNDAWREQTLS